jgi:hypothetical protein
MAYLCECRGPCRRFMRISHETYGWLRSMGAVLTPECADREGRVVLYRYNGTAVVANTTGTHVRPPRSAINPS